MRIRWILLRIVPFVAVFGMLLFAATRDVESQVRRPLGRTTAPAPRTIRPMPRTAVPGSRWTPHPGTDQIKAAIQAPVKAPPPQGVDLVLDECRIACMQRYGTSDADHEFTVANCASGYLSTGFNRVETTIRNRGLSAATFEAGWRTWDMTFQRPPGGGSRWEKGTAGAGGLYIAAESPLSDGNPAYGEGLADPGTYTARIRVDPDNHIQEANESNNEVNCAFTVVRDPNDPRGDVIISSISVSPSSGPPATQFVVTATVKNQGGRATSGSFRVVCDLGGEKTVNSALAAGQSTQVTFPAVSNLPPGSKTVTCEVDPNHQLSGNYDNIWNNNSTSTTFTVTEP